MSSLPSIAELPRATTRKPMRPSAEMADTGIPWVGPAPKAWRVKRLRWTVASSRNGIWGAEPDSVHDILCVRVADFDRIAFRVSADIPTVRSVTASERSGRVLNKGDLLLEKSGGGELQPVGAVAIYDGDRAAVCSNFIARLIPASNCDSRFLSYLHAHLYSARVNVRSIKQTTGIQNLDSYSYFCEQVPVPSLDEQRAIATFLDRETAKIDELSAKKGRVLQLLEERRISSISRVVAASPESKSVRLAYFVDLLPGFAFSSQGFTQNSDDVRLLRGANVAPGFIEWSDVVRWDHDEAKAFGCYALCVGDIVLGMDRPWISDGIRVARIRECDIPSLLLQRVARMRAKNGLLQDFLELLLRSREFIGYFEPILTGVSVPHISPDQIKSFRFNLHSEERQRAAIRQLHGEVARSDELARTTVLVMQKLRELRASLISAAVTGQIDVRKYRRVSLCP